MLKLERKDLETICDVLEILYLVCKPPSAEVLSLSSPFLSFPQAAQASNESTSSLYTKNQKKKSKRKRKELAAT